MYEVIEFMLVLVKDLPRDPLIMTNGTPVIAIKLCAASEGTVANFQDSISLWCVLLLHNLKNYTYKIKYWVITGITSPLPSLSENPHSFKGNGVGYQRYI
jgi:hypothetical protein